jgi:CHAT domain-containing protein
MAGFYKSLLDQQLDKATALRLAQVSMIHKSEDGALAMVVKRGVQAGDEPAEAPGEQQPHSHPYYWAAFILMGNWL